MIEAFYNLKKLPFQKYINTKDLFISKQASELSQCLEHIKQKRGIMLLTGMPGTGKTLHINLATLYNGKDRSDFTPFPILRPISC